TKILLFTSDGGPVQLAVRAIDPANPAAGIASAPTIAVNAAAGFFNNYDVEKVPGADAALFATRLNPTTSYIVGRVTAALGVATATKARVCDGPIAVACTTDGAQVQIARGNGVNVQGDLLNAVT